MSQTSAHDTAPGESDSAPQAHAVYQIKVEGNLDPGWSDWFSGLAVTVEHSGDDTTTTLTGPVADQSALRGILTKLWDLNLALISVAQIDMPEAKG